VRSQPSGNTVGQYDTLRLSCHDTKWRKHAEGKARNTDGFSHYDFNSWWDVY